VIRTSVDHGTAFDIAGTGKADERSMLEAMLLAIQLTRGAVVMPGTLSVAEVVTNLP